MERPSKAFIIKNYIIKIGGFIAEGGYGKTYLAYD